MALSLPLVSHYVEFVADSAEMTSFSPSLVRGQSPQSPSKHITVVDVYDLAASIGRDFEKIIDLYGNDAVNSLMPKVISALETLESMANNNDKENEEIHSLQKAVDRLEAEKAQRMKQGRKFEEEMELIEETYRKDIAELRGMVKALTHENANLVSSLPHHVDSPTTMAMREEDVRMMLELKELSMKQKEEIKQLKRDVEQYTYEVENMENAIGKLIRQNEELLRKNHSLQKQGRMIVEEKIEIMRRLERTEETNIQLRKMLNDTDRVCKDLQQASMLDDEPRFTLSELREVLQEKNILKGRVLELEEELDSLRPRDKKKEIERLDASPEPPPSSREDDDLPVYGPLPKEPEEKLYPWKYERKDSGVRKFFRFFKDLGASPRRGSATNSPRTGRSSISQLAAV